MPRGSAGSLPVKASSPVGVFPPGAAPPVGLPEGVPVGAVGVFPPVAAPPVGVPAGVLAGAVGDAVGVGVDEAAGRTVIVTVCTSAGGVPFDAVIVTVDVRVLSACRRRRRWCR